MVPAILKHSDQKGGRGKKLILLRNLGMRHGGAGQPRARSGKKMVAKGNRRKKLLSIGVIGGRIEVLRSLNIKPGD